MEATEAGEDSSALAVTVPDPDAAMVRLLRRVLACGGVSVTALERDTYSIEQAFIALVGRGDHRDRVSGVIAGGRHRAREGAKSKRGQQES